jgi:CubicO group peptidase (beta-lactamase class C family)
MKYKFFMGALLGGVLSFNVAAQTDEKIQSLDNMIEEGMQDWGIPGLAAVVVKDGEIVFKKTYGLKDRSSQQPVDEQTLFSMASTTKAIVAMAMGMLVDEGKLKWDDKVRDHLPGFKLSDAYITEDARVKDLLTHNLGVRNADFLWLLDSVSTAGTLERFASADKTYPLRGGFVYQNIMYAVAGEVIEAVSGKHWADYVEENIFKRLGIENSYARSVSIFKNGNFANPYYDDPDEGIVQVGHNFSDQIGPAGMIWANISDVGNYLTFLVNNGVYEGDTLIQQETFDYLFHPHTIIPDEMYPTDKLVKPNWKTYGLGWFQQDYRGKKLDFHTGSLSGLVAIAGIMRGENTAVYVFANLDHAELRHAIMYKAMDLWAFDDAEGRDWHREVFALYSEIEEKDRKRRKEREEKRVSDTKTSLALDEYAGTYRHGAWGDLMVTVSEGNLRLNFNDYLSKDTEHWHYDTFRTKKDPKNWSSYLVNFNIDQEGKVKELVFADQQFKRVTE